jgi:hypothetical protein
MDPFQINAIATRRAAKQVLCQTHKTKFFNDLQNHSDQMVRKGRFGPANSRANAPKDAKGCLPVDHARAGTLRR